MSRLHIVEDSDPREEPEEENPRDKKTHMDELLIQVWPEAKKDVDTFLEQVREAVHTPAMAAAPSARIRAIGSAFVPEIIEHLYRLESLIAIAILTEAIPSSLVDNMLAQARAFCQQAAQKRKVRCGNCSNECLMDDCGPAGFCPKCGKRTLSLVQNLVIARPGNG